MNYRDICFREYGKQCGVDDCSEYKDIEVHHIDGDSDNNNVENLVPLCVSHHNKVHRPQIIGEVEPTMQYLRKRLPDESFNTGPDPGDRRTERVRLRLYDDQIRWMEENHIRKSKFVQRAVDKAIDEKRD